MLFRFSMEQTAPTLRFVPSRFFGWHSIVSQYVLPLFFLTLGVCIVLASFGLRLRRPWRSYPACARCGYPTRGLESTICPECGADRAQVGVAPVKPTLKVSEGLLLMLGVLVLGAGLLEMLSRLLF